MMQNKLLTDIKELASTGKHINNPYHNQEHCNQVLDWCIKILSHENLNLKPSEELLWAAAFHDYDHSGGILTDDCNISLAKQGLTSKFYNYYSSKLNDDLEFFEGGYTLAKAHEIIECTMYINGEFPHSPRTYEQKVIRDADLMSIFLSTDESLKMTNGLYTEILLKNPGLTKTDFWKSNKKFLSSVEWFTPYANILSSTLNDRFIELEPLFLS